MKHRKTIIRVFKTKDGEEIKVDWKIWKNLKVKKKQPAPEIKFHVEDGYAVIDEIIWPPVKVELTLEGDVLDE